MKIDSVIKFYNKQLCALSCGDVAVGVLLDSAGETIDEVVVMAIDGGTRIIAGHGGTVTSLAILEFFKGMGAVEKELCDFPALSWNELFLQCQTEKQALAVCRAYEESIKGNGAEYGTLIEGLLKPRRVCLAGAPNTGKSSLMNLLSGGERSLISDIEGTTRDSVEHWTDIGGYYCAVVDTAGLRADAGETEQVALKRTQEELEKSDVIIFLFDGSRELGDADRLAAEKCRSFSDRIIPVINKTDLPCVLDKDMAGNFFADKEFIKISCTEESGIEKLLLKVPELFM